MVIMAESTSFNAASAHSEAAGKSASAAKPAADPVPVEESVLVKRARKGDLAAYDDLVKRYQERIYATVYHMTSNHEDANDLAQEAFIKAYQALKSFKGGSSFYTWVYRIAVNKTINFLKQRKNRAHMSLDDLDFNAEHDPDLVALISDKTPRRDINLAELQEKLNAAMQKLSESHRLVVTLHDVQGASHEEIAKIMNCNIGTVRSRLFYARQQLQAYLSDYLK
jgi:RNA polymerase sigma-70 factor (ECF subfamily)